MEGSRNFNTSKVPRMTEVFPQAVIAGNLIFVSGQAGFNPATGLLSDSFKEQALQAFSNIQTILEEMGSGLDKIVKTTVFMVSGNEFGVLNEVYAEVFPQNAPARSTPQVMPFPAGILISVECIALM
jgi:2-iminobutanoate/2-iminopropanoate deaminase